MPNQQLIDYINKSRQLGQTDDQIRKHLLDVGWAGLDIQIALEFPGSSASQLNPSKNVISSYQKKQSVIGKIAIVVILILIVSVAGFYIYLNFIKKIDTNISVNPPASLPAKTPPVDVVDRAWDVFQQSIAFEKNHNLEGLKSISYQPEKLSNEKDECLKLMSEKECEIVLNEIMDLMHTQSVKIRKSDFVNVPHDNKQLIMYSNPVLDNQTKRYDVNRIFFIINSDSTIKIAGEDFDGSYKISDMADTDQDGITDVEERCEGVHQYKTGCTKTDPNNKDSDGNGWWDGIDKKLKL